MLSHRMQYFEPSVFIKINEAMKSCPVPVCDLSIGTPDLPPPRHITDAFLKSASEADHFKYSVTDTPEMIEAAIEWYGRRFSVTLGRENICGLVGSQDSLAHLPLMLLNPYDIMLIPDPGYPMFKIGPHLTEAEAVDVPLYESNGFLVDYDKIPPSIAHKAKMLIISYPANPMGRLAPMDFFERTVHFARKYDICVVHDNAYSEITFDGNVAHSFLEVAGASDVGVELNSLSKSYNLTGARISFMLGSRDICTAFAAFKSNLDYGIFRPVQDMAIAAITGPQDCLAEQRAEYQRRRDAFIEALSAGGWDVTPPEGTMFIWAKLPPEYPDSLDFTMRLLESTGVAVVPGISFGAHGEGYVRIGLVKPADVMRSAADKIIGFLKQA